MKSIPSQPIGLFDSGIGGLTVLREMNRLLPLESIVYFGDTARIPYGNKSPETIIRYSVENSQFLLSHQIKLLVVACNTASAHALIKLQNSFSIPVLGVINPGASTAVSITSSGRIGIIGTRGTIESKAYEHEILRLLPSAQITSVACPLFVPLVEENFIHHPASKLIVQEYLKPFRESKIDTLVLGCTHYPVLKQMIQEELGNHVTLVDSGASCAQEVARVLIGKEMKSVNCVVKNLFFVSDNPDQFMKLGKSLFDIDVGFVQKIT
jgi:glutamate racemase